MSVKALATLIGARVEVIFESLSIACEVVDVKMSYGKARLLIAPINGSGSQWIEASRVKAFAHQAASGVGMSAAVEGR